MHAIKPLIVILFVLHSKISFSQLAIDSLINNTSIKKWTALAEKKNSKLEKKIVSRTTKTLQKLQNQEEKIYTRMLQGKDSLQAKVLLAQAKEKYARLLNNMNQPPGTQTIIRYVPRLDTLNTTLKFLYESKGGESLRKAFTQTQELQDRFQQAEEIRRFIRERKQQLKSQLENLGLAKQLKQFNKQAYYFSEQIKEYADAFKDSKKAQKKAFELLNKTKAFQDFMRKNSVLASLLRLPGQDLNDPAVLASLAGLQTRSQVNNLIQQQIGGNDPNAMNQFRQNVADAQSQLNQLKEKLSKVSSGGEGLEGTFSSDDIIPEGFKPNPEKTHPLLKRLDYSVNIQTQRATSYFPVTSDVGLGLSYRLSDKKIISVGAAYKLGLGRGWNNIRFTNEGLSLRSSAELKFQKSIWIFAGYEVNYRSSFNSIAQLKNYSAWSPSGLLGLSKVVDVKSKFLKRTKVQLLWDFLSYQQTPRSQPIVLRIGYDLR